MVGKAGPYREGCLRVCKGMWKYYSTFWKRSSDVSPRECVKNGPVMQQSVGCDLCGAHYQHNYSGKFGVENERTKKREKSDKKEQRNRIRRNVRGRCTA